MAMKSDKKDVEQILKRRGRDQSPQVAVSATEIRSCGVMGKPEPIPMGTPGVLGGIVIIWEFEVQFEDLPAFRTFLDNNEVLLRQGISTLDAQAQYLGTYMLHEGGTPYFRTIWAYKELQTMLDLWANLTSGNVRNMVKELRSFWLKDPGRSEARWAPARRNIMGQNHDHDDAFTQLTVEAAQELAAGS
ncbi:hypothetical protein DSM104443_01510 [Usitatibacter rugosus]|uniref:Uncharacterized protein n=1 Tax=Usitatibacter rugosus TaxID=2732067 RepID=A0A6M4GTK7_9PROT|nr:hypothetical protein [Usitatibacter rugosus]QJR10446.1 hypothetical protein DSM104443_01510 [Usitatibacter rugosus]